MPRGTRGPKPDPNRPEGVVGSAKRVLETAMSLSTHGGIGTRRRSLAAKRVVDLVLLTLGAPVWIPLVAGLSLLVWVRMGWPVFFRQVRPGRGGFPFDLIKFRTMTEARDAHGRPRPDADRLTRFGGWLRSTSLDELPELWNVLRGEMSLVGPRPLLMQYLKHYTPEQARRHEVPPGLTGWAQVQGRNALTWEQRFALDTWYVDHGTLVLDLRILVLTIWKVLRREGISAEGEATMPEFAGPSKIGSDPIDGQ